MNFVRCDLVEVMDAYRGPGSAKGVGIWLKPRPGHRPPLHADAELIAVLTPEEARHLRHLLSQLIEWQESQEGSASGDSVSGGAAGGGAGGDP
jgi:hypothetical protein